MPDWLLATLRDVLLPVITGVVGIAGGAIFMRRKYNVDVFTGLIAGVREANEFLRKELSIYREEITMLRDALRKAEEVGRAAVEELKAVKERADEAVQDALHWRQQAKDRESEVAATRLRNEQLIREFGGGR